MLRDGLLNWNTGNADINVHNTGLVRIYDGGRLDESGQGSARLQFVDDFASTLEVNDADGVDLDEI